MVNTLTRDQDVVVCAAGSMPGDLHKLWRTRDRKGYHVEYGFSCMGYEIAGGLGVKMAALDAGEDRDVVVMVGDGSYLMMSQEIVTAVQEGVKLIVVLVQNHGFASIGALSESLGLAALRHPLPLPHGRPGSTVTCSRSTWPPTRPASARGWRRSTASPSSRRPSPRPRRPTSPPSSTSRPTPWFRRPDSPAWWDVPVAEVASLESTRDARATYEDQKSRQRSHLRPATNERDQR